MLPKIENAILHRSDHRLLEIQAMDGVQQRTSLMILYNYESYTYLMCSTEITVCNQHYVQTVSMNTTRIIKVTFKNNKQTV